MERVRYSAKNGIPRRSGRDSQKAFRAISRDPVEEEGRRQDPVLGRCLSSACSRLRRFRDSFRQGKSRGASSVPHRPQALLLAHGGHATPRWGTSSRGRRDSPWRRRTTGTSASSWTRFPARHACQVRRRPHPHAGSSPDVLTHEEKMEVIEVVDGTEPHDPPGWSRYAVPAFHTEYGIAYLGTAGLTEPTPRADAAHTRLSRPSVNVKNFHCASFRERYRILVRRTGRR
jgi:hypothetical protein